MSKQGRRNFEISPNEKSEKTRQPSSDSVRQEVENLLKKGSLNSKDIQGLYEKYNGSEDVVDEIRHLFAERHRDLKDQTRKAAEKIYKKIMEGSKPISAIFEKIMSYKKKYNWTDAETDELYRTVRDLLNGKREDIPAYYRDNTKLDLYRSRIAKLLGFNAGAPQEGKLKIEQGEQGTLQEVLSMADKSSKMHYDVVWQSLQYESCCIEAISGEYKREKGNVSDHIHPLLIALFTSKIQYFDTHLLQSNIGRIIRTRYEGKPIVDEADNLLANDMAGDINDAVCDSDSAINDLKNRYKVQISIWSNVLKARQGDYYGGEPISQFVTILSQCRNNIYDSADQLYNNDETALLRRLFNVFSLRPTYLLTRPLAYNYLAGMGSPYNYFNKHSAMTAMTGGFLQGRDMGGNMGAGFVNAPVYTLTKVAFLTLRLPKIVTAPLSSTLNLGFDPSAAFSSLLGTQYPTAENVEPISLENALTQNIWLPDENGSNVPREQKKVLYSNEVLVFTVNRRVAKANFKTMTSPLTFSQLPLTISNFETLNSFPVIVPELITPNETAGTFRLSSVVACTESTIYQKDRSAHSVITGNVALIACPRDIENGKFDSNYLMYDPIGASHPIKNPNKESSGYINNKPFTYLNSTFSPAGIDGTSTPSFYDRASRGGTLFFYVKSEGYFGPDLYNASNY